MMKKQKTQFISGIASLFVFIILTIGLVTQAEWFSNLNTFGQQLIQHRSTLADAFFINITDLASAPLIGVVSLIILALLFFKKQYSEFMFFGVNLVWFGGVTTQVIKRIIQNPRPTPQLVAETGFSFPSGHTMVSILFYGSLIVLANHYIQNPKLQRIAKFIAIFLIIAIPISRVYVNVHYPTDIIAGLTLGYGLLTISKYVFLNGGQNATINPNVNTSTY